MVYVKYDIIYEITKVSFCDMDTFFVNVHSEVNVCRHVVKCNMFVDLPADPSTCNKKNK